MKLRTNSKGLRGTIRVPGDKSISHRSIILEVSQQAKPRSMISCEAKMCSLQSRCFEI